MPAAPFIAQEPAMIFAAGVAAQAATALAHALQSKNKTGTGSTSTDFANLTADIDALMPGGAPAGSSGAGSGTGSVGGDLFSLGSDLLGSLGVNAYGAPATSPAQAAQAYASTNVQTG